MSAYNCPLEPPHIDADGRVMVHATRKECLKMGFHNRGNVTAQPVPDAPPVGAVETGGKVEPARAQAPAAEASKPKKGKFSILKRKADAPPEGSPQQKDQQEQPRWSRNLSGDATLRFWQFILSGGRGAVELGDRIIHAKKPYDTSKLEFTTSEEEMVKEAMPGLTTRLLQKLGLKSEEEAERLINGLVILRVFGRIFVSVGIHYADEISARAKEKKKEKAAATPQPTDKPIEAPAAPAPPSTDVPTHPLRPTPHEMEEMAKMGVKLDE